TAVPHTGQTRSGSLALITHRRATMSARGIVSQAARRLAGEPGLRLEQGRWQGEAGWTGRDRGGEAVRGSLCPHPLASRGAEPCGLVHLERRPRRLDPPRPRDRADGLAAHGTREAAAARPA